MRLTRQTPTWAGRGLITIALMVATGMVATSLAAESPVTATASASVERLHVGEEADVAITVTIDEGWHINSNEPGLEFLVPTSVSLELPDGVDAVGAIRYPPPVVRQLQLGGSSELRLYVGEVRIEGRLRYGRTAAPDAQPVAVLRYQACRDTLCLRPASVRLPVPVKLSMIEGVARAGFDEEAAEMIARLVAGGLWVIVPGMLLLGLALNLTPCVYPLISVTIAYFGSQTGNSRGRKVWLATVYTLGIAITFSLLGASAAMSGGLFGAALTSPLVLVGVAALMVLLALASFGTFEIRVPAVVASRLGGAGHGAVGALFMGLTMGLVAAPCVGPVIVGLLVFVGSRGDLLLGLALFFLMALGLGIPYVALAIAAGSIAKLPRSGAWLQWTEHLFGCILLAMAIYFVAPLLPPAFARLLMPTFLMLAIVYLAFIDSAGRELRAFLFGRRVTGVVALATLGLVYLPTAETQGTLPFEPFTAAVYDRARASGHAFVVEFGADWCLPCKEMDERTFTDPAVVAAGEGMSFLSVDMTTTDRMTELILESFDVRGAPTTLFFAADGKEWKRRIGFIGPGDFADLLVDVRRTGSHENQSRPTDGQLGV